MIFIKIITIKNIIGKFAIIVKKNNNNVSY